MVKSTLLFKVCSRQDFIRVNLLLRAKPVNRKIVCEYRSF